jgi:DNA-binding GntR family transcriptional regulator
MHFKKSTFVICLAVLIRDIARRLGVNEGFPLLVVHRLFFSSDDTPVAYTKIQGRSDRYKFQTEFEKIR